MDVNIGLMLSTTLKNYRTKLIDQIHNSNAVFYKLKSVGAIKEESGGERIQVPVMYAKNTTSGSYRGYDQLDTTPQEGIDSAEYNWKQYSVSITVSGEEIRKNKGKKWKIIDILDAKTKQARMSLVSNLTAGIFSDGTGNGSKDLTGLEAMVAASGTYGGIDSGAHTWWRAGVESSSEALGLPKMRTAYNTASIGGKDAPDLIVTTQALFEKYEGTFTAVSDTNIAGVWRTQSAGSKKMADGGFESMSFKGVPIVWDEDCPTGTMYFLNTEHMNLTVHEDANFDTSDFVKPENQDAQIAQILFMGNLTCDRRKSFYKLTNKT
jgi:hypothetical protein